MKYSNLIEPNAHLVRRDALGSKPVYYLSDKEQIVIADNIKDILDLTGIEVVVDTDALNEYFTFQNIYSDRTLFQGIKLLPPGHQLEYKNGTLRVSEYYDIPLNRVEMPEPEWKKLIETKLTESVDRLVEEGDGSFLSGGIDSASVAFLASQRTKLKTFTIGFDLTTAKGIEQTFDERESAERIARLIGSEQYEMVLQSRDMQTILPELIYHLEDLRVGMSYPNYYAANLASKFTDNVFSGEGGDELFGGYPWRHDLVKKMTNKNFEKKYFEYWNRLVPKEDKELFFNMKVNTDDPFEQYHKIMQKSEKLPRLERMSYFDAKTFMPACSIVDYKYAKANGITTKAPFMDLELALIAFLMPVEYKYNKSLLRDVMSNHLPTDVINKKKQGFSAPDLSWYQCESLNYIKELLMGENSMSKEYINQKYIGKVILEHSGGLHNHRLLLWSLISFEWWCRIFINYKGEKWET